MTRFVCFVGSENPDYKVPLLCFHAALPRAGVASDAAQRLGTRASQ